MNARLLMACVFALGVSCRSIPVDLERFDQACSADADCTVVSSNLCDCSFSGINNASIDDYNEAIRGLRAHCVGDQDRCGDFRAVCVDNVCDAELVP